MAYEVNTYTEQYVDTPLTNFPVKEDFYNRMTDITSPLMPLVLQYNQYFAAGNMTACNELLKSNPELSQCFFNAEKYNQLRDSIIALERFFLEEVDTMCNSIAQNTIGIEDNPTGEQADVVSYSARKTQELVDRVNRCQSISLPASGWSDTAPYTQTISLEGVTEKDCPGIGKYFQDSETPENVKAQTKAIGMVDKAVAGNGTITFYCYNKKPAVDFQLLVKGV